MFLADSIAVVCYFVTNVSHKKDYLFFTFQRDVIACVFTSVFSWNYKVFFSIEFQKKVFVPGTNLSINNQRVCTFIGSGKNNFIAISGIEN